MNYEGFIKERELLLREQHRTRERELFGCLTETEQAESRQKIGGVRFRVAIG